MPTSETPETAVPWADIVKASSASDCDCRLAVDSVLGGAEETLSVLMTVPLAGDCSSPTLLKLKTWASISVIAVPRPG